MRLSSLHVAAAFGVLLLPTAVPAQQTADSSFDVSVPRPAYRATRPVVVIDEAHANFHTADGRYKPLADLLRNDGYAVRRGTATFATDSLAGIRVLIIANAASPTPAPENAPPAFSDAECTVVAEWVRGGGALLLIADHAPYGSAAENLARRFAVDMGKGFAFDPAHAMASPSLLVFSRDNALLGDHAVFEGRDTTERVSRVVSFTGQSLGVPTGATALLRLGPRAFEAATRPDLRAAADSLANGREPAASQARPVGGRAQGVALRFGKGRVVILGEAAMLSAQVVRFVEGGQPQVFQMGMNAPGSDDRQFALNILHWLSGLLP